MTYGGLRIFNAVARQAIPFGFERPIGTKVGNFLGFLTGRHTMGEIRTIAQAGGRDLERYLAQLFTLLQDHDCLALAPKRYGRGLLAENNCRSGCGPPWPRRSDVSIFGTPLSGLTLG